MIEEYFGLSTAPFRLGTDSRFFYQSDRHKKAMAYLQYGLQQGEGFVVITGGSGVGKSMVVDQFLTAIEGMDVVPIVVSIGHIEPGTMIMHVLGALQIEPAGEGYAAAHEALESFLIDQSEYGSQAIMILDEAQNLSRSVLEEIRMLTNMVHNGSSLLQVFLAGQNELRTTLQRPDMEQLSQRVIASCHLNPLSKEDTALYIDHRMDVAGWEDDHSAFSNTAMDLIYQYTEGVPRRINTFCARVLLHTAVEEKEFVDSHAVESVIADLKAENNFDDEKQAFLSSDDERHDEDIETAPALINSTEDEENQSTLDDLKEPENSSLPHFEMEKPWMQQEELLNGSVVHTENEKTDGETPLREEAPVPRKLRKDDVVVPFKSPGEAPAFAVPRKLTADNVSVPEQKKLKQVMSQVYQKVAQADSLADLKAEIEAYTNMPPEYGVTGATSKEGLEHNEGEYVTMEKREGETAEEMSVEEKEEIAKIKAVLAAFVAETQDTLLEVSEKMQTVLDMTAALEADRKSQMSLISEGLKDVHEELEAITN